MNFIYYIRNKFPKLNSISLKELYILSRLLEECTNMSQIEMLLQSKFQISFCGYQIWEKIKESTPFNDIIDEKDTLYSEKKGILYEKKILYSLGKFLNQQNLINKLDFSNLNRGIIVFLTKNKPWTYCLLSIYLYYIQRFPMPTEVLICSENTKKEDLEIFIKSIISNNDKNPYCIILPDLMPSFLIHITIEIIQNSHLKENDRYLWILVESSSSLFCNYKKSIFFIY